MLYIMNESETEAKSYEDRTRSLIVSLYILHNLVTTNEIHTIVYKMNMN